MSLLRVRRVFDGVEIEVEASSLGWVDDPGDAGTIFLDAHAERRPWRLPVIQSEDGRCWDRVVVLGDGDELAEDLLTRALPRARSLRPATALEEREVRGLRAVFARAWRALASRRLP